MRGMNDKTGKHNDGFEYLKQRIRDILSTPLGSRVMRRHYGSELFKRIDNPTNGELIANIYSDCVTALYNFEPEFEIVSVTVVSIDHGRIILDLEGQFLSNGEVVKLDNIEIKGI